MLMSLVHRPHSEYPDTKTFWSNTVETSHVELLEHLNVAGLNRSLPVNGKRTLDFKDLRTTEHKISL